MKLDVLKMLDLEYLNGLVLEVKANIEQLNNNFLQQYSLEKLKGMTNEEISLLFNKYNISCESILKYFESDFIDDDWEFADLFHDDILYSSELREQTNKDALNELEQLNNKIDSINLSLENQIFELKNTVKFLEMMVQLLNGGSLSEKDIDVLYDYISNSSFNDEEEFLFSYDVVKYILDNERKLTLKSSADENIDGFEKKLNDLYSSSQYREKIENEKIEEPVYSETIMGHYKCYKKLFDSVDLGDTLGQIMENSFELCIAADSSSKTLPKFDFCVKVGALLYLLNQNRGKEVANQEIVADVSMDLEILYKLYADDLILLSYKDNMISLLQEDLEIVSRLNVSGEFKNRIVNRLNLLQLELKNNLISSPRKKEIDEEYEKIKQDFIKLPETVKQVKKLNELKNKIDSLLSKPTGFVIEDYYNCLSDLQSRVIQTIKKVEIYGSSKDIYDEMLAIDEILYQYCELDKNQNKDKVSLKGFILFDFDEEGNMYVVSDLDENKKNNLIDDSVDHKKVESSFEDYSKLINDLLLYGEPEALRVEIPSSVDSILDKVFLDSERTKPTKMVRIRPLRNSLVRFVSQKVLLRSNTEIFKQALSIIQEILPNVQINMNEDFVFYVNISSSIKKSSTDSYNVSINRYNRKSPLYKLFLEDTHKNKLTDEECNLFRDIVHMSIDAYSELEKKNEHLKFDVVKQIGGMKTRG